VLVIAHFSAGSLFQAGQIFAFFSLINMFFRPLRQIAEEFNTFQSAMAATERIDKLLKQEEPIYTIKDPTRLNDRAKGLSFDKVDFAYLPGQAVLKGMSFNISSGQTVAFVGHTGAGKSTIVQLINRLYDIDQGKICVDGVALDQLDLEHWRAQVATIPQDVVIFDGTLADNLRLFDNSIQNQELEDAISGLCLNEFVDDLPLGLETPLGEAGFKLSEGQQQLVAFGRAWVKRPQLLILDEATANVDSRTERQLETALSHLKENRTTILIAHRLSTIQAADRIFVLDHGSVVESGDHQQLLKKQGLYEKLYRRQALSILVEEPIPKEMV
jgi:ABC-type multidrug transport system fused ATPase/permease subunit